MAGQVLQRMNDFANTTPDLFVDGREGIINEAGKKSWILGRTLLRRDDNEIFATGNEAKVEIIFDENSTAEFYNPYQTHTWSSPQVLDEVKVPLRYVVDHMSWSEQELEQNIGEGKTTEAENTAILSLWYSKAMRKWTSLLKKVDSQFWASMHGAAQYTACEGSGGNPAQPHSFFSYATEDASAFHPQNWTTIEGMDPATESGWRCNVETYDYDDRDDSDEDGDGLKHAFRKMRRKMHIQLPKMRNEYFENPEMYRQFIACSGEGIDNYWDLLDAGNDRTYYKNDLDRPDPTYRGIDLVYISDLDTATIYDSAGTGGIGGVAGTWTTYVAEASANYDGPRYYWLNTNYVHPIVHPRHFFKTLDVITPSSQIESHTQPTVLWYNVICKSRKLGCGVISPKA